MNNVSLGHPQETTTTKMHQRCLLNKFLRDKRSERLKEFQEFIVRNSFSKLR